MHLHPINLIGTAVLLDTVKHVYVSVYVSHSNLYLKFNRGILSIVLHKFDWVVTLLQLSDNPP